MEPGRLRYRRPQEGSTMYGTFAASIGIDATSLWAAATSGSTAIAVHLLACMLARMWSAAEATSIWVEIVKRRKEDIVGQFERDQSIEIGALLSAKQDITREQLRLWDASARAWLLTADKAKATQQTQLMLILDNLQGSVNTMPDTYLSVTEAWKVSLTQMNSLVRGIAQKAQRGDILLALACWHLYPDMTVVSPSAAHIVQQDTIFPSGGVVTIGLKDHSSEERSGLHWSLPLAHLRYYGKPVVSKALINTTEQSRITPSQFMIAVLGCVLRSWDIGGNAIVKHSNWLSNLGLELGKSAREGCQVAAELLMVGGEYTWLKLVTEAADSFVNSSGAEKSLATKLVNLGQRYGQGFISEAKSPVFGLLSSGKLVFALKDDEKRIELLRQIAKEMAHEFKLQPHEMFIRYKPSTKHSVYEYATALPIESFKRKHDNQEGSRKTFVHRRWINDGQNFDIAVPGSAYSQLSPGDGASLGATSRNSDLTQEARQAIREDFEVRKNLLISKDELVSARSEEKIEDLEPLKHGVTWERYQTFFGEFVENTSSLEPVNQNGTFFFGSGGILRSLNKKIPLAYRYFWGDFSTGALFMSADRWVKVDPSLDFEKNSLLLHQYSDSNQLDYREVALYLKSYLASPGLNGDTWVMSLKAAATVASIYRNLPEATVDVRVLRYSLHKAAWARPATRRGPKSKTHVKSNSLKLLDLSTPETFSCLAMFESGVYNIDPSQLHNFMAMSAGDSIYVSARLVIDPSVKVPQSCVRRLSGNIGKPGLAFLAPPSDPMCSDVDLARDWNSLDKEPFDLSKGNLDDRFKNTTLHLSFTEAKVEIAVQNRDSGGRDIEAYKLETLVAVYDSDKWIADLDIIKALENKRFWCVPTCGGHSKRDLEIIASNLTTYESREVSQSSSSKAEEESMTRGVGVPSTDAQKPTDTSDEPSKDSISVEPSLSNTSAGDYFSTSEGTLRSLDNMMAIDSWLCLLDPGGNGLSTVRAQGNWEARLAMTSLSVVLGNTTIALPSKVCWQCVKEMMALIHSLEFNGDTIIIA